MALKQRKTQASRKKRTVGKPEVRFSEVLGEFNAKLAALKAPELAKVKKTYAEHKASIGENVEYDDDTKGTEYDGDQFDVAAAFAGCPGSMSGAVEDLATATSREKNYRGPDWAKQCSVGAFDEYLVALK